MPPVRMTCRMLEAVEKRFGACRAPEQIEMLSDNGSAYTAKDTRVFAAQIGLKACFTPVASPQSNGVSLAIVTRTMYGWLLQGKGFVGVWRLVGRGHVYGVMDAA